MDTDRKANPSFLIFNNFALWFRCLSEVSPHWEFIYRLRNRSILKIIFGVILCSFHGLCLDNFSGGSSLDLSLIIFLYSIAFSCLGSDIFEGRSDQHWRVLFHGEEFFYLFRLVHPKTVDRLIHSSNLLIFYFFSFAMQIVSSCDFDWNSKVSECRCEDFVVDSFVVILFLFIVGSQETEATIS